MRHVISHTHSDTHVGVNGYVDVLLKGQDITHSDWFFSVYPFETLIRSTQVILRNLNNYMNVVKWQWKIYDMLMNHPSNRIEMCFERGHFEHHI